MKQFAYKRAGTNATLVYCLIGVTMKAIVVIFSLLAALAACVRGHNYLLASYEEALEVHSFYEGEVDYFRNWLSIDAEDLGYFANVIADGIYAATTETQGQGIARCAARTEANSGAAIWYLNNYIVQTARASNELHMTVIRQLTTWNIKSYDPELFYYSHSELMYDAIDDLYYVHFSNMFRAWLEIAVTYYEIYEDLADCINAALNE